MSKEKSFKIGGWIKIKKLLGLLAATGLVATTGATVVACNNNKDASELASLIIKPGVTSVEQKVSV